MDKSSDRIKEIREQNRAFAYSVGMHLIVFLLAIVLMKATTPLRRALVIDFSLGEQSDVAQSAQTFSKIESKPATERAHPLPPKKISQQDVSSAKEVIIEPEPRVPFIAGIDNPVTVTTPERPSNSALYSAPAASGHATGYGAAISSSLSGQVTAAEKQEMRYVKAHFADIRNAIITKLSYPRLARRMGWTGTVKVSFVVDEDGGVSNVKVLMTSGFEVLDNNAVETVKQCAPYPKPPRSAEMIMPITYRLDE